MQQNCSRSPEDQVPEPAHADDSRGAAGLVRTSATMRMRMIVIVLTLAASVGVLVFAPPGGAEEPDVKTEVVKYAHEDVDLDLAFAVLAAC